MTFQGKSNTKLSTNLSFTIKKILKKMCQFGVSVGNNLEKTEVGKKKLSGSQQSKIFINLQLISLLCIDPDFFAHDSTERLPSSSIKLQNHEGSARRLEMAGDLSPIFVRELHKGNSQCSFYEYRICFKNP